MPSATNYNFSYKITARPADHGVYLLFVDPDIWRRHDGQPTYHGVFTNLCFIDGAVRPVPFGYLMQFSKYDWKKLHTRNW